MKWTTGIEVQVSGAMITGAEVRSDGTCKLTIEIVLPENKEEATTEVTTKKVKVKGDVLKLVEASKLSLDDKFMQYEPEKGTKEARFKESLTKVIQSGVSDFWRPNLDPSFDETGESICYVAGKKPAVGKSKNWWKEVAKKVGLQEGTKKQYVAFLGCLIKKLVEKGWEVSQAWYAVCSDSKKLGHYWNSEYAKHDFEMTGSREVCDFYDLGNSFKILAEDEEEKAGGFWLAGGLYVIDGYYYPLAGLAHCNDVGSDYVDSVGWLVLNCSTDN
ncbi:MAG: hypothetical protein HFJ50_03360 [Clostridia bacterium]|jgi:hypothetical protein|nr:hypothetical protein [Clostridia bacterium]